MWTEARNLFEALTRFLSNGDEEAAREFLTLLAKTGDRWRRPLQNTPPNAANRADVSRVGAEVALEDGIRVLINESMKSEALIVADHFGMNEFDALELVVSGEGQTQHYPNLPRGLCAIICYYDAHRYFCMLVKALILTHANNPSPDGGAMQELAKLADSLLSDHEGCLGLLDRMASFSVAGEFERLNSPRTNGLGNEKHQQILRLVIGDIEMACYEIICLYTLHCSKPDCEKALMSRFVDIARKFNPETHFSHLQLTVWTALLFFVNSARRNGAQRLDSLKDFKRLIDAQEWENPCLKATALFALAVSLSSSEENTVEDFVSSSGTNEQNQVAMEIVTDAIDSMAIEGLHAFVVSVPNLERYSFTVDVVDSTLKGFICRFKNKVNEMYGQCEDELYSLEDRGGESHVSAKTYSNLHFKALVELLADLYKPESPQMIVCSGQFADPKFHDLCDFLQLGKTICSPVLTISFTGMLRSMCKSQQAASFLYNAFKG